MYTTGSVVGSARSSRSAFFPSAFYFFTGGVKKCEIWPLSSTQLFFEPPSFRDESTNRYQNFASGAAMMDVCSPQILRSLVDPL